MKNVIIKTDFNVSLSFKKDKDEYLFKVKGDKDKKRFYIHIDENEKDILKNLEQKYLNKILKSSDMALRLSNKKFIENVTKKQGILKIKKLLEEYLNLQIEIKDLEDSIKSFRKEK